MEASLNSHGANRHSRVIIDLEALRHNYRYLKEAAGGNRLIAVIKADAYGHGALEVAAALKDADAFSVAAVGEAVALRKAGIIQKIIVMGADKMSSIVDYTDRATCPLFGDGAGCVLVEPTTDDVGIIDSLLHSDGSGAPNLHMKAGGSLRPATHETVDRREYFIFQDGQTVFKFAVTKMADISVDMMKKHNIDPEDLTWLVPHQANMRIIEATARRMGIEKEQVMINIQRYGNTTGATIPLCLWDWEGQLKKDDKIILAAFGGGYTWGSVYLKWAYDSKI